VQVAGYLMTASIEDYIALNALATYELRIQKEVSIT
jgi:hypothetical protein